MADESFHDHKADIAVSSNPFFGELGAVNKIKFSIENTREVAKPFLQDVLRHSFLDQELNDKTTEEREAIVTQFKTDMSKYRNMVNSTSAQAFVRMLKPEAKEFATEVWNDQDKQRQIKSSERFGDFATDEETFADTFLTEIRSFHSFVQSISDVPRAGLEPARE